MSFKFGFILLKSIETNTGLREREMKFHYSYTTSQVVLCPTCGVLHYRGFQSEYR